MILNVFPFLALLTIIISFNQAHGNESPEKVQFSVDNINDKFDVQLQKINPHLANGNTPIYIIRENTPLKIERLGKMMELFGEFSMYQDPETTSAAVYFKNTNKFNGVIGVDYVIKDLDYIDGEDKLYPTGRTLFPQILPRFPWTHLKKTRRTKRGNVNSNVQRPLPRRDVVYIEILVMVDGSMIQNQISSPSNRIDYTRIISHVITVFNNVDVLYAKVESPRIKINIAGILIGERAGTFQFLIDKECVQKINKRHQGKTSSFLSLEARCTTNAICSYLDGFRDSYTFLNTFDNIVLLTGLSIHHAVTKREPLHLQGFFNTARWIRYPEQKFPYSVGFCVVRSERFYREYVTIAHELGHGFSVVEHDPEPYVDENGVCCAYMMREDDEVCKKCLRWSPRSEELFTSFFNSPAGCIYLNEPKSLRSKPFKVMSATEQCQCYGYKSALEWYTKVLDMFQLYICEKPLQCVDEAGDIVEPIHPMDGIPCSQEKVCWGRKCRTIGS